VVYIEEETLGGGEERGNKRREGEAVNRGGGRRTGEGEGRGGRKKMMVWGM